MGKIVFKDGSEIEIADVRQTGESLTVEINTKDANHVIESFSNPAAVTVMWYYEGLDLIRGYAGYSKLKSVEFTPGVVESIDYSQTDGTTESGFVERTVDKCRVTMEKVSLIASVAGQTAQNTANIDYLAMEAGLEL